MSMFEGWSRRDIVKRQRVKYEKRIGTLDSEHENKMPSNYQTILKQPNFLKISEFHFSATVTSPDSCLFESFLNNFNTWNWTLMQDFNSDHCKWWQAHWPQPPWPCSTWYCLENSIQDLASLYFVEFKIA